MENKKVERIHLEDGRAAERHVSVNEAGEKVTEIYVEEQRPFKLEKRITEKRKDILAEQKVEKIQDGQIVEVQLSSVDPNVKLQLRDHIATAENAELRSLNYASKKDVADAVVAGVSALLEQQNYQRQQPVLSAQSLIEERVEPKKGSSLLLVGLVVVALIQVAIFGFFVM